MTVAQLKTANKSTVDNNRVTEITDDVQLQVVVNGNDAGGNLYKQISVQDETGGIIVGINATDQAAFLPVGQKLLINMKGLCIGGYGGQAQIGSLYNGGIGRMDLETWKQHVRLVKDDMVKAVADTIDFDPSMNSLMQTGRIVRFRGASVTGEGTQTLATELSMATARPCCAPVPTATLPRCPSRAGRWTSTASAPSITGRGRYSCAPRATSKQNNNQITYKHHETNH